MVEVEELVDKMFQFVLEEVNPAVMLLVEVEELVDKTSGFVIEEVKLKSEIPLAEVEGSFDKMVQFALGKIVVETFLIEEVGMFLIGENEY